MIKSFLVSMFAIFLFTLGAAGAWFYIQMGPAAESTEDAALDVAGTIQEEPDPIPKFNPGLPAVLRGPDLSPDEMVRLNMAMSAREEQSRQHEEKLREIRIRIQTADADTKAAQREVEGAMSQARQVMEAAEALLNEVQTTLTDLKKESQELQKRRDDIDKLEEEMGEGAAANIKAFAEYVEKMPAEVAADLVKEMVQDNKMDDVIQLLKSMEPRNASKLLAELDDSPLLAEIATRYTSALKYR